MKLTENNYDYRTKPFDGENPFDPNRVGVSYYDGLLQDPEYYKKHKGVVGSIEYMTPEEYFHACAKGFNSTFGAQVNGLGSKAVQDVKDVLDRGISLTVPYLNYSGNSFAQEGRHRMKAVADIFGWDYEVPVLVVRDAPTTMEAQETTVYNALAAYPRYADKYGRNDAWFELKYNFHLTNDELIWAINRALKKGWIDEYGKEAALRILGINSIEESYQVLDELNPKLWQQDGTLRPEVHDKLVEIQNEFIEQLNENNIPVAVLDAWIVGSNASYNYTDQSDLDLHIIVDSNASSCDAAVLQILYNYFKSNFNSKYDISIHGIDVELYIEDVNSNAVSNGIYSLKQNKWIKKPIKADIPEVQLDSELLQKWTDKYNNVVAGVSAQTAQDLVNELYLLRKQSLATEGEYGQGNLIFKEFRNNGYLDKLKEIAAGDKSKELSLESKKLRGDVSMKNTLYEAIINNASREIRCYDRTTGEELCFNLEEGVMDGYTLFIKVLAEKLNYEGDEFNSTVNLWEFCNNNTDVLEKMFENATTVRECYDHLVQFINEGVSIKEGARLAKCLSTSNIITESLKEENAPSYSTELMQKLTDLPEGSIIEIRNTEGTVDKAFRKVSTSAGIWVCTKEGTAESAYTTDLATDYKDDGWMIDYVQAEGLHRTAIKQGIKENTSMDSTTNKLAEAPDEKKEVFVYKAMDINGNGVYKIFYDDGTYEILKGGKAYERSMGDYDKFVSIETLRHATAPPKSAIRQSRKRENVSIQENVSGDASKLVDVLSIAKKIGINTIPELMDFQERHKGEDLLVALKDYEKEFDAAGEELKENSVKKTKLKKINKPQKTMEENTQQRDVYYVSYKANNVYQAILAKAGSEQEAKDKVQKRVPNAEILNVRVAYAGDKKPGIPVVEHTVAIKESSNISTASIQSFLEKSVKQLQEGEADVCRYILDDTFALYMGWTGGWDAPEKGEPDNIIRSEQDPSYAIECRICVRNDFYWAELDSLDRPYVKTRYGLDVWDESDVTISPDEDYKWLAEFYVRTYKDLLKDFKDGTIVTEYTEGCHKRSHNKRIKESLYSTLDLDDIDDIVSDVVNEVKKKDCVVTADAEYNSDISRIMLFVTLKNGEEHTNTVNLEELDTPEQLRRSLKNKFELMTDIYENVEDNNQVNRGQTVEDYLRELLIKSTQARLQKLKDIAPPTIISNLQKKLQHYKNGGKLDIKGSPELFQQPFEDIVWRTGNMGKKYAVINRSIYYFPSAKYGSYLRKHPNPDENEEGSTSTPDTVLQTESNRNSSVPITEDPNELFVYKALDLNGNPVYKVFYKDGTSRIIKGTEAYERYPNEYNKYVTLNALYRAKLPKSLKESGEHDDIFEEWSRSDYVEEGDTIYSDGQDYYITDILDTKDVDGYELAFVEVSTGANIGANVPKKLVGNQDYYYFVLLNGDVEWGVCDTYEQAKEWYDGVEDGYYDYDSDHAQEWMDRHPHGWYNNEYDYGVEDGDHEEDDIYQFYHDSSEHELRKMGAFDNLNADLD